MVDIVVIMNGDSDLLQVVRALRAAGRFSGRLNRRQQQGDQDADDRDHDQQFDQGKTSAFRTIAFAWHPLFTKDSNQEQTGSPACVTYGFWPGGIRPGQSSSSVICITPIAV